MKSLSLQSFPFAIAALLALTHVTADPIPRPVPLPVPAGLKTLTDEGCFHSGEGLKLNQTYIFQSKGNCQPICVGLNQPVMATTNGSQCWCGNELPPASSKVANSFCNVGCTGYPSEMCGGNGYFTVYLTGLTDSAPNADASPSDSSSKSSPSSTTGPSPNKPTTVTIGGQTVVVTAPAQTEKSSGGGGSNKGAIAAGVVVGIVGAAALAGGLFLFMRNKKRRELEEEHRRNAAINSIMTASKTGAGSGSSSFSDTRLDPIMAQRRMSDGSIADNEDYSRRILKVTNA
ncbi:hypothetical protein F5884DRAFT_848870 [Xylogone sp. PMI_703]|nr:hypothetical protein F5884DRAFT_848870 [Xylogone sp. PMI_703]